jgi:hypothetical protein
MPRSDCATASSVSLGLPDESRSSAFMLSGRGHSMQGNHGRRPRPTGLSLVPAIRASVELLNGQQPTGLTGSRQSRCRNRRQILLPSARAAGFAVTRAAVDSAHPAISSRGPLRPAPLRARTRTVARSLPDGPAGFSRYISTSKPRGNRARYSSRLGSSR